MKDAMGFVHVKGSLKGGTNSTNIFILPVGSRPSASVHFGVITDNAGYDGFGSVFVGIAGNVRSGVGTSVIKTFDGVNFFAGG